MRPRVPEWYSLSRFETLYGNTLNLNELQRFKTDILANIVIQTTINDANCARVTSVQTPCL